MSVAPPTAAATAGQDARRDVRHRGGAPARSIFFVGDGQRAQSGARRGDGQPRVEPADVRGDRDARAATSCVAQATTLAENPTLKAALDTYAAESHDRRRRVQQQLLNTIDARARQGRRARRIRRDRARRHCTRTRSPPRAAGRSSGRAAQSVAARRRSAGRRHAIDGVARIGGGDVPRRRRAACVSDGTTLGTLYLATSLDRRFAQQLGALARTRLRSSATASWSRARWRRAVEARVRGARCRHRRRRRHAEIHGESQRLPASVRRRRHGVLRAHVDRRVVARAAIADARSTLLLIAIGAMGLALLGSIWLAHLPQRTDRPAVRHRCTAMAASRQCRRRGCR